MFLYWHLLSLFGHDIPILLAQPSFKASLYDLPSHLDLTAFECSQHLSDCCEQSAGSNVSLHWNNWDSPPICKSVACSRQVSAVDHKVKLGMILITCGTDHSKEEGQLLARNPEGAWWLDCLTEISYDQVKGRWNRGGYIVQKIAMGSQVLWKKRTKLCNFYRRNIPKSYVDIGGYRYPINKQTQILFVILLPVVLNWSRAPTDTVARIINDHDHPKVNSTLLQHLMFSSQAYQVKDQGLPKIFCYPKWP